MSYLQKMSKDVDGILSLNKGRELTSHDVVARVRKLLGQRRVGHAGTLDPAASGVLPICVGQGTRIAEYLSESGKAYQATITFGIVTDTYDAEGSILRSTETINLTQAHIEAALAHFRGPQMQTPPRYSALKIQGQPAYKYARAGTEIVLEARPIEISHLALLAWEPPHLTIAVECSKGTYIRSLAYDLGERLGPGAHLSALVRTRSGPFSLAESITLEQLASALEQDRLEEHLFPIEHALQHLPALSLDPATAQGILHGKAFRVHNVLSQPSLPLARMYDSEGNFLAIACWDSQQQLWQPKKVFRGNLASTR